LKDDRFTDAEVDLTVVGADLTVVGADEFRLKIRITPSAGPNFDLVLSVADAAVKLLSTTQVG